MEIREARTDDAAAVLGLVEQLRSADDEDLPPLTLPWVERYLGGGGDSALVAEVDGAVVGLLTYRIHDDLFHGGPTSLIEELVVDEAFRGRGVGTALVEEALRIAVESGCVGVAVSTERENERAQALYRRVGLTSESLLLGRHFEPRT